MTEQSRNLRLNGEARASRYIGQHAHANLIFRCHRRMLVETGPKVRDDDLPYLSLTGMHGTEKPGSQR